MNYDQRIQRFIRTMESMGAEVTVWDRRTKRYPSGAIETRWSHGPAMYLDYNRIIARMIRHHKSDLIYAADIDVMPGLIFGLRHNREIPVILDLHEWFPQVIELEGRPLKKSVWQWIEQRSVAFATAHMTVNQSLRRIFEEKYEKNFTVVRNVPEIQADKQTNPENRLNNRILYYQGALNKGRGLLTALDALKLLPGWRLWLVGTGDIESEIKVKARVEAMTDKEGLEDRVVFFGRKSPEELHKLAGQATVGLNLLSGVSKSYYYSLANRYFDYIHAGLPAIHMNYPEYQKLMDEYTVGCLIDDLSSESVMRNVQQMTRNKELYFKMVEQCSLAKLEYNWKNESKVLLEVINGIKI